MRITFIGQAPSRETDGQPPFVGKCGRFLAEDLLGTTQEQMLKDHDFYNLLNRWPGKGINGDKFPMAEARTAAARLLPQLRNKLVILVGANVARAFGANAFAYGMWYAMANPKDVNDVIVPLMSVIPHPSGVNRYYNDPEKRIFISKFLQATVRREELPTWRETLVGTSTKLS